MFGLSCPKFCFTCTKLPNLGPYFQILALVLQQMVSFNLCMSWWTFSLFLHCNIPASANETVNPRHSYHSWKASYILKSGNNSVVWPAQCAAILYESDQWAKITPSPLPSTILDLGCVSFSMQTFAAIAGVWKWWRLLSESLPFLLHDEGLLTKCAQPLHLAY